MKVIQLKVANYGGIEAFEAKFDGKHGLVRGPNGSGKTSSLNALIFALGGKVEDGLGQPLRQGQDKLEVELELGGVDEGYRITKVIETGKAPKLVVRDRDDRKVAKPATFLQSLVPSGIAFRPMDFGRLDAKKQRAILLAATGAEEVVTEADAEIKDAYEERRHLNRQLADIDGELRTFGPEVDEAPDTPVDVGTVAKQLADAENAATAHANWKRQVAELEQAHLEMKARTDRLQAELNEATRKQAELRDRFTTAQNAEPAQPTEQAVAELREQLGKAEAVNSSIYRKRDKANLASKRATVAEAVDAQQKRMDAAEVAKREVLQKAQIVPGLEVREDGVYVDGLPFASINTQQQFEVAIGVALKQNPKLRCVLVDGAEAMDLAHWDHLVKQADAANLQIIATEVAREGGELSFEIVEGSDG